MELRLDKNLISPNETIAVALSGGMDSVALLYALIDLAKAKPFVLKAINVEHGIRGEESISDSEFVKKLCDKLSIELKSYAVDVPTFCRKEGIGTEQGARMLRYNCFEDALASGFCDKIATAHHANDLVETVLFNLFRGSGISGVKGIPKFSHNGTIIRPLLSVSREEIRQYVDYHHISYVTDSTNNDTSYSRNYIREKVIPLLKDKFPELEKSIARFSASAEADDNYLFSIAETQVDKSPDKATISVELEKPIFARASILAMKHCGIEKDYTKQHIDDIYSLISKSVGSEISLIHGVRAIREYDKIVFLKKEPEEMQPIKVELGTFNSTLFEIKIENSSALEFKNHKKQCYSAINGEKSNSIQFVDGDKLSNYCVLRSPILGDEFKKLNGGTKSLKKLLVDLKISKTDRKSLAVIARGQNILVICGIAVSDYAKITDDTTNFIKISTIKRG